jgi:hypothetical protein
VCTDKERVVIGHPIEVLLLERPDSEDLDLGAADEDSVRSGRVTPFRPLACD